MAIVFINILSFTIMQRIALYKHNIIINTDHYLCACAAVTMDGTQTLFMA